MSNDPPTPRPPAAAAPFADHDALPPGTRFGEFEIVRVLGVGGFGIVYLAQDHSLERQVALKEYMPASLASRGAGPAVTIRSGSFAETYAIGLRSFVNEARLLARFDHPSLVKVYRFWEDNATAYMVMPYLQGVTLRDARRAMGHAPDEAWIRGVLEPMLDALDQLHREGVFHRDIAPDNILLPPEGAPILLDFGAARRVISDRTQSLTAILKPSYAPIEQYADMTAMRQGPWTDVYALGAVVHYLLFGAPPAPATARAVQSDTEQIEHRVVPGVSAHFMSVVAWMLGVRPLDRPQNVASVRAALSGQMPVPSLAGNTRAGITLPGDSGPMPLADAAPYGDARIEPTFQQTLRVESHSAAHTRSETAFEQTAWAPMAGTVPPPTPVRAAAHASPASAGAPPTVPPTMPPPAAPSGAGVPGARPVAEPARRGRVFGAVAALAVLAGVVLWQFVGVLGSARPALIADQPASSASSVASGDASAVITTPAATPMAAPVTAPGAAPSATTTAASAAPTPATAAVPALPTAASAVLSTAPVLTAAGGAPVAAAPASDGAKAARSEGGAKVATAAIGASTPASAVARLKPRAVPARVLDSAIVTGTDGAIEDVMPRGMITGRDAPPPARQLPFPTGAAPSSAREACGSRVFIAMALCMERECENPRFRDQPECARLMEIKRNRSGGQ
jgi:serine/threonine protein kinase